eukprot:CAMPEP_0171089032 /NCGR_PEP_ID=MMETSP0766_2-20121228/21134_1 /TAXON_ID=439317 /ORGANISM="Gambierdiscus australes, Strain CAWD 149" /LENGTH=49 /DNA_ID=CAMNT_0011546861 /DNA_START=158 /DNA_END=307 /DNA_ORIENTATION=-
MMQLYADTTSGAERKRNFKVKKARRASPPPCLETGTGEQCEGGDEFSLR